MKVELGIFMIFGMAFSVVVFAAESPQESVQILLQTIQKIKTRDRVNLEQEKGKSLLSAKALTFLDMGTVGRKTLGKYWGQRSSQEKKDFVVLLSRLFEKIAFPNSAQFFSDLDIHYKKDEVEGDRATVTILVKHEKEGEVEIDFMMHRTQTKWLVVDVILDGVSMRSNLRSQLYKVIAKNDYAELVRRINKKLKGNK